MSLYIGAKFFRSETPQNIRYEHDEAAYLFTVTRHWLTECAPLRSPRRTFASANDKGRGILRSSSKRRKETTYVGPVKLGHFPFFHPHSLPTPTSYGRLSYVVFVVGTIEIQMSVFSENFGHLSVNPIQTLQNVVGVLKKDRGSLLLPIGGTGGRGGNGMSNFIFSLPLFTSLQRYWKFHNCFTCEFTTHCASKNVGMNLKSTTTNGFNFRIINSLMALAGYS